MDNFPRLLQTRNPSEYLASSGAGVEKGSQPALGKQEDYYGLPILKRPFWKWEIALYFFSEGISAGSYILAEVADLFGKGRFEHSIRWGRYLAFSFMLPCPALLISDLGRPERFHHMLRITKRTSPMNHGAWALSSYGIFSAIVAALELPADRITLLRGPLGFLRRFLPNRAVRLLGMLPAFVMVSYPGVLLSTTSIPVWAHTYFMGPLLACSSMSTAVAAITLCNYHSLENARPAFGKLEDLTAGAELVAVAAYVTTARRAARPLLRGKQSKLFTWGAVALGLIIPAILRRSKSKPIRSGLAPLLTLAGGLALKWSLTYAGRESALDRELAIHNAPTKTGEPFWGPNLPGR